MTRRGKDTILGNAGRHPEENFGIVNPPVYHASTVTFPTVAALEEASSRPLEGVYYGRFGTPTSRAFEEAVAALEGGNKCIALPSGLAAITCALLSFLKTGDHILVTDSAYFPTRKFCDGILKNFGVETTYFDPMIAGDIENLMRPQTKVVFVESPGSLSFEVQDIPAISEVAQDGGAIVIMDNTWSAGIYFDAFAHGVDVSVQAATKYIVGHSDAMLGTITTRDDNLYERMKWQAVELGFSVGPDDCYLGLRGLRTLITRLQRHQETAIALAEFLSTRGEVASVLHPAFPDCPGHDVWRRDFTGATGLFSVVMREGVSKESVAAMLDGLELFAMGYSWGGFESLILPIHPAAMRTATQWAEPGPVIRIHAGLEDSGDLIADLEAGLGRLSGG